MTSRFHKQIDSLISCRAFFGRGVFHECVPAPSHRYGEIELAAANMFHSAGMNFEGRWPSVRGPHHDNEVEGIAVPAGEELVGPVDLRILRLVADLFFHQSNDGSG